MESEFEPQPQESGSLGPPRRKPPTAVGTMELPPPKPPRGRYPEGRSLLRRIALAVLAAVLLGAGLAVLWPLGWRVVAGVALVALGRRVIRRALARSGRHMFVSSPRTRGESYVRSA
jgi:hypothetical protein